MKSLVVAVAVTACALALAGCMGDDTNPVAPGAPDATTDATSADAARGDANADVDAGPSYDAADLDVLYPMNVEAAVYRPRAVYGGGPLLRAPRVVTISFASMDPSMRTWLESFDDTITTTPYWTQVTGEYCQDDGGCIGAGTSGGHVVLPGPAPSFLSDAPAFNDAGTGYTLTDLQAVFRDGIDDGTIPAPTPETIYVLFVPATTDIAWNGGRQCVDWGGYHGHFDASYLAPDAGQNPLTYNGASVVPYAVVADCGLGRDVSTVVAAHELIEAATDSLFGFQVVDVASRLDAPRANELADLCDGDSVLVSPYQAQQNWSNAAVVAGQYPCVPNPGLHEFNVAYPAHGAELAVGDTATLDVVGFSDVPHRPWHIDIVDMATVNADGGVDGGPFIAASLDDPWMHAGKTVHATITLLRAPTSLTLGQPAAGFYVRSSAEDGEHWEPGAVIQTK